MRSKSIAVMVLVFLVCAVSHGEEKVQKAGAAQQRGASLATVLGDYERLSGATIEVVSGVDCRLTMKPDKPMTVQATLKLIKAKLAEQKRLAELEKKRQSPI